MRSSGLHRRSPPGRGPALSGAQRSERAQKASPGRPPPPPPPAGGVHPAPRRLEPVWNSDSLDWKDLPASEIIQRVTGKVQPGSIVLFHNAALHTPEALPAILETLLQEGYTFVPISQLILPGTCGTDYTIDHTGRQCPA